LSTKLVRLTWRAIVPSAPHFSHFTGAGSFIFCSTSIRVPHFSQVYS